MKVEHSGLVEQTDLDALESWDALRGFAQAASLAEALAGTTVTQATLAAERDLGGAWGTAKGRELAEAVVLRRAAWRVLAKQARAVRPRSGGL